MKILRWESMNDGDRSAALRRPGQEVEKETLATVRRIIEQVRVDRDAALRALTRRYDGVEVGVLRASDAEFAEARTRVAPELIAAMDEARQRITAWHRAGMAHAYEMETAPGVRCGRILRGIRRVGLYVPAGSAPLPSTALMLGVPASLAGCAEVVLCTPPGPDGRVDPTVLVAAKSCGIDRVFKVGGAQAIAAMAFGTESIPACDKLFGPGNSFVTACKEQVSVMPGGPAIDMPAGPSELLVIADAGAQALNVAADLLSQAEHGSDSQVLLVSDSEALLDDVRAQLERQLADLPRADICRASLAHARFLLVDALDSAFDISNDYAPEHLILALRSPRDWLDRVQRAGSVFLGDDACETLGDYCSGTNHVLPTNGAARSHGGLSVASFQNAISIQSVSREGLRAIGPCAVTLARAEGLEAHARAVTLRMATAP